MKTREKNVSPESNYYTYSPSFNAKECFLYPTCLGHFIYGPGYELERESFDSILIEVILDGNIMVETEGRTFLAKKNDVVLIDCYQRHRYYSEKGAEALWIHFDGVSARGYYNWISKLNGNVFTLRNVYQIKKHLNTIYEMFHSTGALNETQIALELAQCMILMLSSDTESNAKSNLEAMDEILYYISEHLEEELPVKELAALAHLSEYYFIRVFRETMGMTPRQYIISVRMEHAKYLLKTTSFTVQEIGYMVGYASESMFCTTFKKQYGVTPSEYRSNGR